MIKVVEHIYKSMYSGRATFYEKLIVVVITFVAACAIALCLV